MKRTRIFPWLAAVFPTLVQAQVTIRVPADAPTIQAGIDLAAAGDTVLVAAGVYPETIDFLGKAITVRSEEGALATTIDATGLLGPVVRFHLGEGTGSILRGFTITGGTSAGVPGAGISCLASLADLVAGPTLRSCIVRGNQASGAPGGGVAGAALLEDCTITGNSAGDSEGGGVWGSATLLRCTVSGNVAREGGGLFLTGSGAFVGESFVLENSAREGARGGGIAIVGADATVQRTVVARNLADGLGLVPGAGGGVYVEGSTTGARLERCTIVANRVAGSGAPGDVGGLFGPASLTDSIVGSNEGPEVVAAIVTFSDVEGGYPGRGNIDDNPLFKDTGNGDFSLLPGSPCLDRGDPDSPLDPDCTRADMGALYLPRAGIAVRNGTGINRLCFLSLSFPVLGGVWSSRILTAGHSGAALAGLTGRLRPLEPGLVVPAGELLIDMSSPVLLRLLQPAGGPHVQFDLPVPGDPGLVGFVGTFQGFIIGGGVELCNALDVKLGF